MKISAIKSPEKRAKLFSRIKKNALAWTRGRNEASTPIFVAGMQRSGTTLLMNIMHLCPNIDVHDEAKRSTVYRDFCIRDFSILQSSIQQSKFEFSAYKVLCDSHKVLELLGGFPRAKLIWSFREARDNAASRLKKFPHATHAIRLVCQKQSGGGWFADGISDDVSNTLGSLGRKNLTEFDYCCLAWWARNMLFFEQNLDRRKNVILLNYERLATSPVQTLSEVFERIGCPWSNRYSRYVHSRSVKKPDLQQRDPAVASLCDELYGRMLELANQEVSI